MRQNEPTTQPLDRFMRQFYFVCSQFRRTAVRELCRVVRLASALAGSGPLAWRAARLTQSLQSVMLKNDDTLSASKKTCKEPEHNNTRHGRRGNAIRHMLDKKVFVCKKGEKSN